MPKLSVWFVRASLVYMAIGFLFGSLILHHKGVPIYTWTWRLLNPHIEIMIYGWTMQFVMGVAFWILPRFSGRERYGMVKLGWWSFGLLNFGLALNLLDAWLTLSWLSPAGRVCILASVIAYVVMMWPRVKPLSEYFSTQ